MILLLGLKIWAWKEKKFKRCIFNIADKLGIRSFLSFPPTFLSGGEKQKIAITSVLVINPDYIIFDEVTSLLDPYNRIVVVRLVQEIRKDKGIIYITHNPEEVTNSDRIIVLDKGRIIKNGTPVEVFKEIDELKEKGVCTLNEAELSNKLLQNGLIRNFTLNVDE